MKYLGCEGCSNYHEITLVDYLGSYCWANVDNPIKCPLRKRVLNEDIAEFFWATCERYKDENRTTNKTRT